MSRERNLDDAAADAMSDPRADAAGSAAPVETLGDEELAELGDGEDVDGDYNGAPELAGIDESQRWTGVDSLDAMHGRDARAANLSDDEPAVQLAAELEQLREELVERLEALRAEMPERIAASDAAPAGTPDAIEPIEDAAAMAASLAARIERLQEALERLEPDGETPT